DPEAVYHALWAIAYEDAHAALPEAETVLRDAKPEKRFAAVTLLSHLQIPEARPILLAMMDDNDIRLAVAAHRACVYTPAWDYAEDGSTRNTQDDQFERLEKLLERIPERKTVSMKPLIWPWTALSIDRSALLNDLIHLRGDRPLSRVLKYR